MPKGAFVERQRCRWCRTSRSPGEKTSEAFREGRLLAVVGIGVLAARLGQITTQLVIAQGCNVIEKPVHIGIGQAARDVCVLRADGSLRNENRRAEAERLDALVGDDVSRRQVDGYSRRGPTTATDLSEYRRRSLL